MKLWPDNYDRDEKRPDPPQSLELWLAVAFVVVAFMVALALYKNVTHQP